MYTVCILSQIGDFGMARDLMDDTYYKSSGGKIPVKWTAPEVKKLHKIVFVKIMLNILPIQAYKLVLIS